MKTFCENKLVGLKFLVGIFMGIIVFFPLNIFSQINYSCDMEGSGCGPDWDNNGFAYSSGSNGGSCSGYGVYDNVWSSNTKTTTWNGTAITGHTGGDITVTVKTRLLDYYSPNSDRSSSEWGSLKIYYNTSIPSEGSPGLQIGSTISYSYDCQTHSVTFSPGTTFTNLYIAIEYNYGSGDNYIWFDDVTITETPSTPSLSASWTVGDGAFAACESTASSVEEYTVNASNLTGDLTATPPAGFEISLSSGSGYISNPSTLTIPQANAEAGDIIYVRMASGSSSPTTANLSISGGGLASATTTSLSGTITAAPDAGTLSGTSAVCSDGSTTFSSDGDAGGTWTSGSTGVATINSSTGAISPVAGGTSTITYTVTGTGGCSDATSTRDVVVTAAPNAGTLSGTNAICSDGSTTFSSDGDSGGVWSSGDTGVATVNSSTGAITPVAGGTSTITYTVTGTGGCSDAASTRDVTISSDTYYVKPAASGGSDSNNGLTSGTAFATLQKAIDMVGCSSTTINVAAGTYTEDGIEIPDGTSNLTITGAGMGSTIFDGTQSDRFILLNNSGDSDASGNSSGITISDMTIKEYRKTSGGGAAIKIEENITTVNLNNIKFESNQTTGNDLGHGGAVLIEDGCTVTLTGCTFESNDAGYSSSSDFTKGGGLYSWGEDANNSTLTLNSCIFSNNDANDYGGGMGQQYTNLTMNNCLFYENNSDDYGGALNGYYGNIEAKNITFSDNSSTDYGGAFHGYYGSHNFYNSIFYGNSGYSSYDEIYEYYGTITLEYCILAGGSGNTSGATSNNEVGQSDPLFTDASSDDYTLQSSSPAVDVGSSSYAPATDILGVSRPKGSADDLGCYEFNPNTWVGGTSLNETTWTTASNWSNGTVPTSSESPIIANVTYQPEISSSVTLAGLTIDSGADITVSSNSLTVTGTFDLNGTMNIDNATVNADATFDATGGTIDFTNANGKLILSSDVTSLGTLDAAMGTVEYDNSSNCDILSDTYYNLELDGASVKTAVGNVTVNGDFILQSACTRYRTGSYTTTVEGDTDINSELRINGASAIFDANGIFDATGGTVDMNNSAARLQLSSTVTSLGTLDELIGTVEYDGSTQNVLADTYYNLEIDQSGTKTSQGTITVASDLTVQSGATFAIDATTITVTGTSDINGTTTLSTGTFNADGASDIDGTLSISSTGVYDADGSFDATSGNVTFTGNGRLQCSSTVTSLGTLSTDNGTVEYDGATQTVFGDNYYNLEIDVSGTKTAGGAINVDGDLSTAATAGCKLDMGAYALNLAGDLTVGYRNGLDASDASCSITFDGNSDQQINHSGSSSGTGSTAITTEQVNSSANDGFQYTSTGNTFASSSNIRLGSRDSGSSYGDCIAGFRFTSVPVPQGAFIESASISVNAYEYSTTSINLKIRAEDVDDGTSFTTGTGNNNISSRSVTTAGVDWDVSTTWSYDNWYTSVDISTVIQEIVDRGGWVSGNDLNIIIQDDGSGSTSNRNISSYDWSSSSAPKLDITYSTLTNTSGLFNDLIINKTSGNLILNDEILISGTITFTSGDIDASSNNLVLESGADVSGADDDSHVVGTIVKTIASDASHEFPLGNGSVLRKVDIDPNDATSRDWTVTYTNNVYSDVTTTGLLTYVSDTCYWDITPTSTPASTTVKLNWTSAIGINDADLSNIKLAHYNGTDWELISTTTTGVPLAGSVSGNVTSFSPFTIGTTGANPLPVTLTQFEGYAYSDLDNKLEWTTKTEKNADYMEIQHSDDGKYFNSIGISKLAGNSQTDLFYEFIDRSVAKQINYYRLKQFDYDGKFNYSKIISIDNRHTEAKVVKYMTNLIGQKVDKNYKGVVIIYYTDGSSIKTIQ